MSNPEHTKLAVDAEAVSWAFRLLIGREPFDKDEVARNLHYQDLEKLRIGFANTWEFQDFFDRIGFGRANYRMPMFLMRPPEDPTIPFAFTPPDLDRVMCQMMTAAQYNDPVYIEIVEAMKLPYKKTRQLWEQVWTVSVLATAGMMGAGRRVLGLNVGNSRIPALLMSRGVEVMVADPVTPVADIGVLRSTRAGELFVPEIVNLDDLEALLRHEMLDAEALPASINGMFDAVWSIGLMETLGPRDRCLEAIKGTLACLKPGGIAVHTVVLNISSDKATVDRPKYTALRRRDLEALAQALQAEGHKIEALNFHPGLSPKDDELTSGPGSKLRPKWRNGVHVLTSFGLVIRKGP